MTALQKNNKYYVYAAAIAMALSALVVGTTMWSFFAFSVLQFIFFSIVISYVNNRGGSFFKSNNLVIITLLCLALGVASNLIFSQRINGNLYVFSEADAVAYYESGIFLSKLPFSTTFEYLSLYYPYDDWGGFFLTAVILRVLPSKIFLNIIYVLLGTLTSFLIFNVGRKIMSDRYAFLSALTFSISSFSIFFYSTSLKEPYMITIVAVALYFFYNYLQGKNKMQLALSIIFTVLLVFFRAAVAYFMLLAGGITILMSMNIKSTKLYASVLIFAIVAVSLWGSFEGIVNRYIGANDAQYMQRLEYAAEESLGVRASLVVSAAASLAGPFPALLPKINQGGVSYISLYGPGLLFRLMLTLPFWIGAWVCVKHRVVKAYPLILFPLFEMVSLSIVLEGLELRLNMPHMPAVFLCAFWLMYIVDSGQWRPKQFIITLFNFWPAVVVMLAFLWNFR